MEDRKLGLSSENRNFIVGIITVVLLLWGPVNLYGIIIRIAVPVVAWYLLKFFGKFWHADQPVNERLYVMLLSIVAAGFFFGAYHYYTASYHSQCTEAVRTRDGTECVGDYVTASGPDKGAAFMLALLGAGTAWFAIVGHKKDSD